MHTLTLSTKHLTTLKRSLLTAEAHSDDPEQIRELQTVIDEQTVIPAGNPMEYGRKLEAQLLGEIVGGE